MKISCPSCGASFNVKAEALGASGRKVKCGRCAHQWHALPDGTVAPSEATVVSSPPDPAPPDEAANVPTAVVETVTATETDSALPDEVVNVPTAEAESVPPDEVETAEPSLSRLLANTAGDDFPTPDMASPEPTPELEKETPPEFRYEQPPKFGLPELSAAEEPERPPGDAVEARPLRTETEKEASAGRSLASRIAVSALVAAGAMIILVGGAIFLQPQITSLVPAAASLYARLGLQPSDIPGFGLEIVEPTPRKLVEGEDEILEVVGLIRNDTKNPLQIPLMQARLLDGDGKPLNVWQFRAAKPSIAPGESVEYTTRFRNPPATAERLDITFTREQTSAKASPDLARKPAAGPMKQEPAK